MGEYFKRLDLEQLTSLLVREKDFLAEATKTYEQAAGDMARSKTRISNIEAAIKEKGGTV